MNFSRVHTENQRNGPNNYTITITQTKFVIQPVQRNATRTTVETATKETQTDLTPEEPHHSPVCFSDEPIINAYMHTIADYYDCQEKDHQVPDVGREVSVETQNVNEETLKLQLKIGRETLEKQGEAPPVRRYSPTELRAFRRESHDKPSRESPPPPKRVRHVVKQVENDFVPYEEDGNIVMGPNQTTIKISELEALPWQSKSSAVRQLLELVFPREILASHSLTGNPSPGKNKFTIL